MRFPVEGGQENAMPAVPWEKFGISRGNYRPSSTCLAVTLSLAYLQQMLPGAMAVARAPGPVGSCPPKQE